MKINRCRVCGKTPSLVGVKHENGIIYHRVECRCGNNVRSVSSLEAQNAGPKDFTVVSPDTGPTAVRENGQVVAVRAFQVF